MFAYCKRCDYDSGDCSTMKELRRKVKDDGGKLDKNNNVCPKCGHTLRID